MVGTLAGGPLELGLSFPTAVRTADCSEVVMSIHYIFWRRNIGLRLCLKSRKRKINDF